MGQLIKIYPNNPQEAALEKVVRALRDGALIIPQCSSINSFTH